MSGTARGGRIVTFYSYKGGTGRSMALANVAWILASQGRRVLVIDWDLEAPGLHRYFHPFLDDPELTDSPGLIDFFCEFVEAGRRAKRAGGVSASEAASPTDPAWHEAFYSLLRYTYSLDYDFGEGVLDFVPAGQQGAAYALRVNDFKWQELYDSLGGGILLEGLKRRLREEYDDVLIDSRTGISDTSGICTVQMPDDLVVCFTLNQQSVKGAAAVAASADDQRRRPSGEPALRIWPVPTRVELAEKERLDAARDVARETFQRYLRHLPRSVRAAYWSTAEVLYQPFYAYEEVLAVFAEQGRQRASMLSSFEALTGYLTGGEVTAIADIPAETRAKALAAYRRPLLPKVNAGAATGVAAKKVFIAFPREDFEATARVADALLARFGAGVIWWESDEILPGDDWDASLRDAFESAGIILACFGPGWLGRTGRRTFESQLTRALDQGRRIVPVLVGDIEIIDWINKLQVHDDPRLAKLHAATVSKVTFNADIERVANALTRARERAANASPTSVALDPEDPQKGQWGGRAADQGRTLSAEVREVSSGWYEIVLTVARTGGAPLTGPVTFHLHPTFRPSMKTVQPSDGRATTSLLAWGAFTVGAQADQGATRLELDLSAVSSFPTQFTSR